MYLSLFLLMDKYIFSLYVMVTFAIFKYLDAKFIKKEVILPKHIIRDCAITYFSCVTAFFVQEFIGKGDNLNNKIAVYTGEAGF